jgi:hypothetical protein
LRGKTEYSFYLPSRLADLFVEDGVVESVLLGELGFRGLQARAHLLGTVRPAAAQTLGEHGGRRRVDEDRDRLRIQSLDRVRAADVDLEDKIASGIDRATDLRPRRAVQMSAVLLVLGELFRRDGFAERRLVDESVVLALDLTGALRTRRPRRRQCEFGIAAA